MADTTIGRFHVIHSSLNKVRQDQCHLNASHPLTLQSDDRFVGNGRAEPPKM